MTVKTLRQIKLLPIDMTVLVLLGSAVARIALLSRYVVIGDDSAGYIYAANGLIHGNFATQGLAQHFGVAVLLAPYVALGNSYMGAQTLAVAASLFLMYPIYRVARMALPEWPALTVAAIGLWWPIYGATLGFGFAPLLSLSCALLAFVAVREEKYIWAAVCSAGVLAFSQSLAPPLALAIAMYVTMKQPTGSLLRNIAGFGTLVTFAAILALPSHYGNHIVLASLDRLVLVAFGLAAVLWYSRRMTPEHGRPLVALALSGFVLSAFTVEGNVWMAAVFGRAHYLAWAAVLTMSIHAMWEYFKANNTPPEWFASLGLLALVPIGVMWMLNFNMMAMYRSTFTSDSQRAVTWVDEHTNPGDRIVVHPESLAQFVNNGLVIYTTHDKWEAQDYAPDVTAALLAADTQARAGIEGDASAIRGIRYAVVKRTSDAPKPAWPVVYTSGDTQVVEVGEEN